MAIWIRLIVALATLAIILGAMWTIKRPSDRESEVERMCLDSGFASYRYVDGEGYCIKLLKGTEYVVPVGRIGE
jgi:hypothetical protein